jgi:hypothetical protein
MCPMTARTSQTPAIAGWFGEPQQFGKRHGSHMMHTSAHGHLHSFQIHAPAAVLFSEDAPQQGGHIPRDLRLDRLRCFFSSGVSVSSTGRNAQMFSLTSTSWPQSS